MNAGFLLFTLTLSLTKQKLIHDNTFHPLKLTSACFILNRPESKLEIDVWNPVNISLVYTFWIRSNEVFLFSVSLELKGNGTLTKRNKTVMLLQGSADRHVLLLTPGCYCRLDTMYTKTITW